MICPKCQNLMQTVDRRGVHIEQCQGCRGIFLDRGELEQMVGAEQSYYGAAAAPPAYRADSPPPRVRLPHIRDSEIRTVPPGSLRRAFRIVRKQTFDPVAGSRLPSA